MCDDLLLQAFYLEKNQKLWYAERSIAEGRHHTFRSEQTNGLIDADPKQDIEDKLHIKRRLLLPSHKDE